VWNLSYFFEADRDGGIDPVTYTRELSDAIATWQAAYSTSNLTYLEQDGRVVIVDSRTLFCGKRIRVLDDLESRIYLLCDRARAPSSIAREITGTCASDVSRVLHDLCETGTMWSDGVQYLSLAVSFTEFLQSRASPQVEQAIDAVLSGHS